MTDELLRDRLSECSDGFLVAQGAPHDYWGELDSDDFRSLYQSVRSSADFGIAVANFFETHTRKDLYAYITDTNGRTAWHTFLARQRGGVAVDLGAGLGAISEALSKRYDRVYGIEGCRERCRFLHLRKQMKQLKNLTVIHGGLEALPFQDQSVDLVACNGVLEWVAFQGQGAVRQIQASFLREIRRVLKPDGILYVGIENRFARAYFGGQLDHNGKKYTTLMPRWLASLASRDWKTNSGFSAVPRQSGYRTYTYTLAGYRRLLTRAGFSENTFICAEHSYDCPQYAFPVDIKRDDMGRFARTFIRAKYRHFISRHMCANYFIFAGSYGASDSIRAEPTYFGYFDTMRIRQRTVERRNLLGEVRFEGLVDGIPITEQIPSRVTTQQVVRTYRDFLLGADTLKPSDMAECLALSIGVLKESLPFCHFQSVLKVLERHRNGPYHGDFCLQNIVANSDGCGLVLIDAEPHTFGSYSLDVADFIIDFRLYQRGTQFPAIDCEEVASSLSVRIDKELLMLALLRQVLRYSPSHRSHPLFWRYRSLLIRYLEGDSLF